MVENIHTTKKSIQSRSCGGIDRRFALPETMPSGVYGRVFCMEFLFRMLFCCNCICFQLLRLCSVRAATIAIAFVGERHTVKRHTHPSTLSMVVSCFSSRENLSRARVLVLSVFVCVAGTVKRLTKQFSNVRFSGGYKRNRTNRGGRKWRDEKGVQKGTIKSLHNSLSPPYRQANAHIQHVPHKHANT